jgi:hypothetical protein
LIVLQEGAMQISRYFLAIALGSAALLPSVSQAKVEFLKEEPPKDALRYLEVVYVDDGTCPAGEVKEITGGNSKRSIPRKVRCVKRPE